MYATANSSKTTMISRLESTSVDVRSDLVLDLHTPADKNDDPRRVAETGEPTNFGDFHAPGGR